MSTDSSAPLILLVADPHRHRDGPVQRAAAMLRTGGYATEAVWSGPSEDGQSEDPSSGSGVAWGQPLHRRLERCREDGSAPAAVLAVGGDGMSHTVLNVLQEHQERGGPPIPFGLIPTGTGNDLARHMRLPHGDPEMAAGRVLRRLDEGPADMDLGLIELADGTRRWFATAACCGIDAVVNELANTWSWPRGSAKYAAAVPVEAMRYRQSHMALAIRRPDGTELLSSRRTLMLSVANTSSIGGGLSIVPHADPRDGRLEVFQVRALSRARILLLFPRLILGAHLGLDEVAIEPAVRVEVDAPNLICADGESVGRGPAIISVAPAALPVLF
ncbi:hypothetical protein M3E18_06155 [Kocuria sp. p3-SID1433]|uniref:diacylglycerol kinase family protein n=1 Tax=unclassified Kocuria TaxID=2649579 RepID=UPI0021A284DA|nr:MULTISPECIES: diacylglycerol kinase family protein [unclassified Kocuria]MCT1601749.1 hypothetical protein [Kocuria sp. p3-SID1428]MCT2180125.1 hypothetical protein [Kocuria sp. p3-SID1433]